MATLEELEARYGLTGSKPLGNTMMQPAAPAPTAPMMPQLPKIKDPLSNPMTPTEPSAPASPAVPKPSSVIPEPPAEPVLPVQDNYLTDKTTSSQQTIMSPQTKAAIGGLDNSYKAVSQASNEVADATVKQNTVDAEHESVLANYKQAQEEEKVTRLQAHQDEVANKLSEIDNYSKQLASEQPKGFWEDKSTLQRIGLAMAVAMGNVGDAMAGGRGDTGNQMLQSIMDKETQGQQERYKQARQRIADMKLDAEAKDNLFMKLEQQNDAVTLAKLGAYQAQLGKLATETQNAVVKAKFKESEARLGAEIQDKKIQTFQKYEKAVTSSSTQREMQAVPKKPLFETADKLQEFAAKDPNLSETKAAMKLERSLKQAVDKNGKMTAIQAAKFISSAEGLSQGSYGQEFSNALQTSILGPNGVVGTLKAWIDNKKDGDNFVPDGLAQSILKYSNDLTKSAFTNPALESSFSIVNDSERALFGGKAPATAELAAKPVVVRQGNVEKVVSYNNYVKMKKVAPDINLVGVHKGE